MNIDLLSIASSLVTPSRTKWKATAAAAHFFFKQVDPWYIVLYNTDWSSPTHRSSNNPQQIPQRTNVLCRLSLVGRTINTPLSLGTPIDRSIIQVNIKPARDFLVTVSPAHMHQQQMTNPFPLGSGISGGRTSFLSFSVIVDGIRPILLLKCCWSDAWHNRIIQHLGILILTQVCE